MWDDGEVTSDQLTDLNKFRKDRLNKAARLGFGPLAHQVIRERSRSRERMRKVIDNAPRPPMLKQQLAQRQAVKRSAGDEPDINAFLAPKPVKGIVLSKAATARLAAEAAGRMNNAPGKYVQREDRYSVDALEASAAASAAAFRSLTPQVTTAVGFVQRDETIAAAFAATRDEIQSQYVLKDPEERKAVAVSSGARAKARSAPPSNTAPCVDEKAALDRLKGKLSRNSKLEDERSDDDAQSDEESDERERQTFSDEKQRLKREKRKRNEWRRKWREDQKRRRHRKNDDSSEEDESSDRDGSSEERDAETIARRAREANSDAANVASNARRNYSGQMSDRDLERRLKEQEAEEKGAKLMSEAEVLAKIQRNRKR